MTDACCVRHDLVVTARGAAPTVKLIEDECEHIPSPAKARRARPRGYQSPLHCVWDLWTIWEENVIWHAERLSAPEVVAIQLAHLEHAEFECGRQYSPNRPFVQVATSGYASMGIDE